MQPQSNRRICAITAAALGILGVGVAVAPAASAAPGGTVTIASTLPRWLPNAQKNDVSRFAVAAQNIRVYLAPNGGLAALQAKAASLSDTSSKEYGQWLSVAQYNATFQPTQAEVDSVSTYLTSNGVTVTGVDPSRRYVTATADPSQLGKALNVSLDSYTHDGQTVTAPSSAVTLPADVGAAVLTITGLDTTVTKKSHNHVTADVTPPASFVNAKPCSISFGSLLAKFKADFKTPLPTFQGQTLPYAPCGYTGPQLRAAYEGATDLTGAGQTVAITDAYRWQRIAYDANRYAVNHGDGAYLRGQLTESRAAAYTNQDTCDPSGWSGEETLDVEAVHAMAPAANIRYYASASCLDSDFLDTLGRVVDENIAKVVTNSWSDVEEVEGADNVAAYEAVFLQGAVEGISFLFSSGDNGDELARTGVKQVDYPASDPYATAVGGTSTEIGPGGVLAAQSGWGTNKYTLSADGKSWTPVGFLYGAGGGFSALFNRPTYQNGKVPASAPAGRGVPDIAMDADPNTGMLIGQTQTFPTSVHYGEYRIGGTSLASPLYAGELALALQKTGAKGFGLLNPSLYAAKGVFIDVKPTTHLGDVRPDYVNRNDPSGGIVYSVRTFGQDSSLPVTKGWDAVTGLGVPNPSLFAAASPATTATVPAPTGTGGMNGTPTN